MSAILSEQKRQIFLRGKRLFVAILALPPSHPCACCVVGHTDGLLAFLERYVIILHRLSFTYVSRESPTPWCAATFGHELDPKCRHFMLAALLPVLPLPGTIAETSLDEYRLPFTQIFPAAF